MQTETQTYIVLGPEDYRVLGPQDFGNDGLEAIESIGPFVEIQASGPLIMVHDSTIDAHLGIGHHPHRHNERIFYIMEGELDHDDSRNNIQGHMGKGDVGLFTEGLAGMVHSEWNNGDTQAHAYILVYSTDPIPSQTAFTALRSEDAPVYDEGTGVRTKELVGPKSPLEINGDIRLFTDSVMEPKAALTVAAGDAEGALVSVQEGTVKLDGREVARGQTIVLPPAAGERSITLLATEPSRVLRTVYGPGHGFVRGRRRG